MYNRYMQKVRDVDDYIELDRDDSPRRPSPGPIPDQPPHTPPFYAPSGHHPPQEHNTHEEHEPPKTSILSSLLGGDGEEHGSLLSKLLGGFHIPSLDLDDILLFAILFLILRDSGDEDLLLIIAALYFLGND